MSNPSMIMVEAGGVDKGPAVEAAAKPPEVAPAGSEEELSASQGLLLEPGSTPGLPSCWVISTPANPGLSSSIVAAESAGGECWNCSNGSSRGNGGGVSVTWSSSSPVLVVLLVASSGGGEEEEVVKR